MLITRRFRWRRSAEHPCSQFQRCTHIIIGKRKSRGEYPGFLRQPFGQFGLLGEAQDGGETLMPTSSWAAVKERLAQEFKLHLPLIMK